MQKPERELRFGHPAVGAAAVPTRGLAEALRHPPAALDEAAEVELGEAVAEVRRVPPHGHHAAELAPLKRRGRLEARLAAVDPPLQDKVPPRGLLEELRGAGRERGAAQGAGLGHADGAQG